MKHLILCISMMGLLLSPQTVSAACNWNTDIKKTEDGFVYPADCHGEVGVIYKTNKLREQEIVQLKGQIEDLEVSKQKLTKSLELKDLALVKADEMSIRWREESYNQHERLLRHDRLSSTNRWVSFTLGFLAASLSVYAAGQLVR